MHAGPGTEPGGRDDEGLDERPLHAVEDGRLVPLVDHPDRGEHHSRPQVERTADEEVDVGLLQLQFAVGLRRHDGVLQL